MSRGRVECVEAPVRAVGTWAPEAEAVSRGCVKPVDALCEPWVHEAYGGTARAVGAWSPREPYGHRGPRGRGTHTGGHPQ